MAAGNEYYEWVERPEPGQLLFATSKKTAAWLCGILVLSVVVLLWLYWRPGLPLHGIKGVAKLGFAFFLLLLLALAGANLYLALVGRSFLVDGTAKLVSKNGKRVAGFGGIRLVEVKLGYHPAIFPAGRSYALCLRLKSGESLALAGLRWMSWAEFFSSAEDQELNNEDAANSLEAIAQEVAELIGVRVAKSGR
jgi:hypothetical protein